MKNALQPRRRLRASIESLESRRLLSGGQLDTSFSGDGKATAKFTTDLTNTAVAIEGNKTLIVGTAGVNDDIAMARFNFDGSPDTSFGSAGTGVIQIHPDGDSDNLNVAEAVAIDGQGRIVVVGAAGDNMLVLRFNSNGSLDKSFDHDGIVGIDFGFGNSAQANTVAIQTDGKIVVAGEGGFTGNQIAVARLNSNGSLDTTFGDTVVVLNKISHTGKEILDFGDSSSADAIALDYSASQTNPRIVLAGDFRSGSANKMEIMRLKSDGSLDTSFDQDGKVAFSLPTDNSNFATGLALQSGKVVVTGFAGAKFGQNEVFVALRLNINGSIDKSFGDQGDGVEAVGFGGDDEATSLTVGLNGRLFLGGSFSGKIAVAALTPNGILDKNFGTGGKTSTSLATGIGEFRSVGIGYLGDRVVVASPNFTSGTANVVRFLDINPTVGAGQFLTTASEQGPTSVSFLVTRDQTLPFDTKVNFTIGGTASAPTFFALKDKTADYTLTNMSIPQVAMVGHPLAPPFVDIPAGQSVVIVTLTPIDDTLKEGTETATFSINSDPSYSIGTPNHVSFNILDNDTAAAKTLNPTADAYVEDGSNAGKNFGTASQLVVKKSGTSGDNRLTYLKFDLSSVSSINSVKLNLFGELNNTQQTDLVTQVFSVADTSWSETGITFNNKPAAGSSALASATILDTTPRTYTWDVTSYVKSQFAAGHKVVSFVLENAANSNPAVLFNSREAGSNKPALVVT
jgi:uncharacterized delta-60 repeat protein